MGSYISGVETMENFQDVITSGVETLKSHVGEPKQYEGQTPYTTVARETAELLVQEGCEDKAAIIAAIFADLPYTTRILKKTVKPMYGARAANAWHELVMARTYGHLKECKNKKCLDPNCEQDRLLHKAPYMGGPARAAMMAWFSILASRVSGRNPSDGCSREMDAEYLGRISSVSSAIHEKGSKVKLSPVIEKLAEKIQHTVKNF